MKLWNQEEISTYMYTDARNPFANIAMIGNAGAENWVRFGVG